MPKTCTSVIRDEFPEKPNAAWTFVSSDDSAVGGDILSALARQLIALALTKENQTKDDSAAP